MQRFDPFSDRVSRSIRNSLTEALVEELGGNNDNTLIQTIRHWRSQKLDPVYKSYLDDRQARYENILNIIKSERIQDPRLQAVVLWNNHLFFELHELLETIWMPAAEPERTGLKGLIQAAGVYVHLQRGKEAAARNLAKRAREHLITGKESLPFIANIDALINALKHPSFPSPSLLPNPNYN